MPMSKKTYELVAAITKVNWLAAQGKPAAEKVLCSMVHNYVDAFSRDNESFDRARFLSAAVPRFARAHYDLCGAEEPDLFEDEVDPCCLLYREHYAEDHEYGCAVRAEKMTGRRA